MSVRVKITGVKEIQGVLRQIDHRARKLAAAAMFQEGERVMAKSKEEAPVGVDGTLRASGFVKPPEDTGKTITVELGYGGAAKGYAVYVHEGTGPAVGEPAFMPPPEALEPWVQKKMGVPSDEVENVAFLVARKIGRTGLKPTKYLERPLREAANGMGQRIAAKIRTGLG